MIRSIILDSLRRYVEYHCPTGGFLEAVLCNDLKEAIGRADDYNLALLPEIVRYCYWEIPSSCWGSPQKVKDWLAQTPETPTINTLRGLEAENHALRSPRSDDLPVSHTPAPPKIIHNPIKTYAEDPRDIERASVEVKLSPEDTA